MSDDHVSDGAGPSMPDATTLHHAFIALIEGLTAAAKEYQEALTLEDQRSASQGAIMAVLMFLQRTGAPSDLRPPLFDLCLALDELGKGAVEPILAKKKIGRIPRLSLKRRETRAKVAFACHLLLKSGLSLDEASRYCARQLGSSITREQVIDWREQAASGFSSEDIASRLYKSFAKEVGISAQTDPGEARRIADQFLEVARIEFARRNPK